jgi:hypothetical protein
MFPMRTTFPPFDFRDATPAAIKCTIFYDDCASGLHGRHFAEMLAARLGVACDCASLWRMDVVESFPDLSDHAAGDAAKSDVIIFVLRGDRHIPSHFERWVESWLALLPERGCSVIALFASAFEAPPGASATRSFLRQRCAAADVAFFACQSADDPSRNASAPGSPLITSS